MLKKRKAPNRLISFQVDDRLNEALRDAAWTDRKTLSALIREYVLSGLGKRRSGGREAQGADSEGRTRYEKTL